MSTKETIYIREGRYFKEDGDIQFDFQTYDGIGLPNFSPSRYPGGFPRRINEIINLDTRTDDIILATYPKCGTHWTSEILNMLVRGNANYLKDTKISSMMEAIDDWSFVDSQQSPRVLNTHFPYKWFPKKHVENGGKIIHTTRNPKDAYVSCFHQLSNVLELGLKTKNMTWAQFFDTSVLGKGMLYGTWFDYEKEMNKAKRNNKSIYTVHFEKLKEEPEQEIKAIANFLDLEVSDDLIKDIAQKCLFQNLKKAKEEVRANSPEIKKMLEKRKHLNPDFKPPVIYRKGIVGDWKNHFTVAQNEHFDALYEREMKGTDIKVIY